MSNEHDNICFVLIGCSETRTSNARSVATVREPKCISVQCSSFAVNRPAVSPGALVKILMKNGKML